MVVALLGCDSSSRAEKGFDFRSDAPDPERDRLLEEASGTAGGGWKPEPLRDQAGPRRGCWGLLVIFMCCGCF